MHPVSQLMLLIWQGRYFRRLLAGQLVCMLASNPYSSFHVNLGVFR